MTYPIAKDLMQQDIDHLVHPVTNLSEHAQVGPKVFVKGEGAILTDIHGNDYIDGLACLWNVTAGHGRKELAQAAFDQMSTLGFASSFGGFSHLPSINLSTRLATLTPGTLNHFQFTCGGAESNETAFKMARFYWKLRGENDRVKVISRRNGYHGITIATMSATGIPAYHKMFEPMAPGFVHTAAPYCYRCEFGKTYPNCNLECAQALEETILAEGPNTVAAFIAEPVMGAGGVIIPPKEYFPKIREICDKYEVLFIADEVITGFGRTGTYFGIQNWNVIPDMMTMAKGITSGYIPLGAVAVSDRINDQFVSGPPDVSFMHGYTYSGHPTCCAVALATLDIIDREKLPQQAREKGQVLWQNLQQLKELSLVGEVRSLGLIGAVELVRSKDSKEKFTPPLTAERQVIAECFKRGLICRPSPNGIAAGRRQMASRWRHRW
ncbi:MAG: aspartate aminotransferase family protein [Chloroflexi bacterium]|nr:aspartate aminotransferase family protein [Chloroflexota bacterium]